MTLAVIADLHPYLKALDAAPEGTFGEEAKATDAYVHFLENRSNHILGVAYQAVESGLPAILCFKGQKSWHAMTVVGHTFNPGLWSTRAYDEYLKAHEHSSLTLSSFEWVDGLIVMDGNFGPYKVLTRRFLQHHLLKVVMPCFPWAKSLMKWGKDAAKITSHATLQSQSFVGAPWIMPAQRRAEKILRQPLIPEAKLSEIVSKLANEGVDTSLAPTYLDYIFHLYRYPQAPLYWFHELRRHLREGRCVLRTIPCTLDDYLDFLKRERVFGGYGDDESVYLEAVREHIFHRCFWLVEISVRELYEWNKHRLGEIIFCEGGDGQELQAAFLRVPGFIDFMDGDGDPYPIAVDGHYHYPLSTMTPDKLISLFA